MAVFVINEWVWADISGQNGPSAVRLTLALLEELIASPHQVVVVVGSAFDRKGWSLLKANSPIASRIARLWILGIRQDPNRSYLIEPTQLPGLPESLLPNVKPDDHYLVQAQLAMPGAILVTTDTPLLETVTNHGLPCIMRGALFAEHFPGIPQT